jgi:hypothetical protein
VTGTTRRVARLLWLLVAAWASTAGATPNVPLEDPVYLQLEQLRAQGKLPPYLGGARPLTEAEIQRLLMQAGAAPDPRLLAPDVASAWLRPATLVTLRGALIDEHVRPYSTEVRPRDIAGFVAVSCEHQEGRPCGPGAGLGLELDSSAGYGSWLSAYTRLRFDAGNHAYSPAFDVDRAYLNIEAGPIAFEVGRDVQVLGPAERSALMLSDHAAPLDHVRISTARPLNLIGENGSILRLSLRYFVGVLRDPQRFHHTLVTGSRAQLDLFDGLELGGTRLLQLGGDGAPSFTFGQFVAEHFIRQSGPTGVGISNNRLSFDISYSFRALRGARAYYELAFEDNRKQFINTLEFQTDHLVGLELLNLDGAGHHGVLLEFHRTGSDSQEHSLFTTGMTNADRTLGSPLGPDAWSLYSAARIDLNALSLSPWAELVRMSSDVYTATENGPVVRVSSGVVEHRFRAGMDAFLTLPAGTTLRLRAFAERVGNSDFIEGATRVNGGVLVAFTWAPSQGAGVYMRE